MKLSRTCLLRSALLLAAAALVITVPSSFAAERKIRVTTTTSMVTDLVQQVGGDRVEVAGLMGAGVDPHLYKATASDVSKLQQAEVNYTQVKIQYDRSGTQRDLGRQRAELDLAEANANLDRLVNPRASDIATARASLEAARANMASTTANANNDVERAQSDLNTAQRNLPLIQEAYSQALYDWDGVKNDEKHAQYDRRRQAYVDAQNALDAGTTAMNNANQTLIAAKANRQQSRSCKIQKAAARHSFSFVKLYF